jgi:mRNA-degrading endonuclease RelE of RelBE toxin-antitoxin system
MTPAPPAFTVRTSSRYDRLAKALQRRHQEFFNHHRSALRILATDPYNRSRVHHIKKLEDMREDEGQYRLALGRWRFRYDILGTVVLLGYCGLRREDTY